MGKGHPVVYDLMYRAQNTIKLIAIAFLLEAMQQSLKSITTGEQFNLPIFGLNDDLAL